MLLNIHQVTLTAHTLEGRDLAQLYTQKGWQHQLLGLAAANVATDRPVRYLTLCAAREPGEGGLGLPFS